MYRKLLVAILAISFFQVNAQNHNCGVDAEANALIKQRMLENRARYGINGSKNGQNKAAITYIPVTMHAVSNSSGVGAPTDKQLVDELCGLNALYLSMDIQFFIYNQFNYLTNNNIDVDATSNASANAMNSNKVAGTVNLYAGRSINNQAASFYSPFGDYCFLLNGMLGPSAKTTGHEVGHFFTLPHTFSDWENIDVVADYGGGPVPNNVPRSGWPFGTFVPENVPRTGSQANCNFRGDGFCDTEADYVAFRAMCPYVPSYTDPNGVALDPDESLVMSYASDACVTTFSPQQQTAINNDIASRSWISNTSPNTTDLSSAPAITVVSPTNGAQLGSILNPTVQLQWSPVTGASWYLIKITGPGVNIEKMLWSSSTTYNLSTTGMVDGGTYFWRVAPMNNSSTCAAYNNFSLFTATNGTTGITSLTSNEVNIFPNPVTNLLSIDLGSSVEKNWSYTIFDVTGRQMDVSTNVFSGNTQIDVSDLSSGTYIINIKLGDQIVRKKFSKQ